MKEQSAEKSKGRSGVAEGIDQVKLGKATPRKTQGGEDREESLATLCATSKVRA